MGMPQRRRKDASLAAMLGQLFGGHEQRAMRAPEAGGMVPIAAFDAPATQAEIEAKLAEIGYPAER